jgi:hypothetical protein
MKITTTSLNVFTGGKSFKATTAKTILFLALMLFVQFVNAATYYLTSVGAANAQSPESWNTLPTGGGSTATNFSTNGDVFIVPTGINGVTTGNFVFGNAVAPANLSLIVNGGLAISPGNTLMLTQNNGGTNSVTVNGTIDFRGSSANQLVGVVSGTGSPANNSFTLAAGATLMTANSGGVIGLLTGAINTNIASSLSTQANYVFNGGSQSTTGLPQVVNNLTLAGTGSKSINANQNVNGTLSMQGTATATGSSVVYGPNGTLEYKGSISQISSSVEFPAVNGPVNLVMNNPAGLTLHATRTIPGVLNLVAGYINVQDYNLVLVYPSSSIVGGSKTSFVYTPGNGGLKWMNATALSTIFFPIGHTASTAGYVPLTMVFNPGSHIDNFTAIAVDRLTADGTRTGAIYGDQDHVLKMMWWIHKDSHYNVDANITMQWNGTDEGANFDRNSLYFAHYSDGYWSFMDSAQAAVGTDPYFYTVEHYDCTFSPFSLGNYASPLPVKLISFSAMEKDNKGLIQWATASEHNNDYFSVEKSSDGVNFETIGTVKGAGESYSTLNYSYIDENLAGGVSYYRLKQMDYNGEFAYSNIAAIDNRSAAATFAVYPNPATTQVTVANKLENNAVIEMNDMSGKVVYRTTIGANQYQEIPTSGLPRGIYAVKYITNSDVISQKIVVR